MEQPKDKNNEYRQNARYFRQSPLIQPIGLALIAIAIILFFGHFGYVGYIFMSIALPLGIFLAVIGISHEGEVTSHLRRAVEDVGPGFEEEQELKKHLSHKVGVTVAEGFIYREGLPLKKSKGGTIYSSRYAKAVFYPLEDALVLFGRTVSLTEADRSDFTERIPYGSIRTFAITTENATLAHGKRSFTVKRTELTLAYGEDKTLTLPIADDIATAALVEFVQKNAKEMTEA
jgi:hypothetical protein